MNPKQKITLPYTYRDDFSKLKSELESGLEAVRPTIDKELQSTIKDAETRKAMQRGIEKQLHKMMLMVTSKCNQLLQYRTDRQISEKPRLQKPEDQALIKYNEAESIIMKEAYERCRGRKVAPKAPVSITEPSRLKVDVGDSKQVDVEEFCKQTAVNYQQSQKRQLIEVEKRETFMATKSTKLVQEIAKHGESVKLLPIGDWQLLN